MNGAFHKLIQVLSLHRVFFFFSCFSYFILLFTHVIFACYFTLISFNISVYSVLINNYSVLTKQLLLSLNNYSVTLLTPGKSHCGSSTAVTIIYLKYFLHLSAKKLSQSAAEHIWKTFLHLGLNL